MGCVLPRFHALGASYFVRKYALLQNKYFIVRFCQSAKGTSKVWVIGSFNVIAKKLVLTGK